MVEEYPSRYDVATARQHRWTRGDWQLLPWVLGVHSVAAAARTLEDVRQFAQVAWRRRFSRDSRCAGWDPRRLRGACFSSRTIVLPPLLPFIVTRCRAVADFSVEVICARCRGAWQSRADRLRLVFWADQAWTMTDAIVRTLYRLSISRRNLLQWTTTAQSHAPGVGHGARILPRHVRQPPAGGGFDRAAACDRAAECPGSPCRSS